MPPKRKNEAEDNPGVAAQRPRVDKPKPIPLDRSFAEHLKLPYGGEVYKDYSCTLTFADIAKNENKYFVIQMTKDGEKYHVCSRSGQVGCIEEKKVTSTFGSEAEADKKFCKLFEEKTGNEWINRSEFVRKPTKGFTMLEMDPCDMPLGRLSKNQIQKAKEALTELEATIKKDASVFTPEPVNAQGVPPVRSNILEKKRVIDEKMTLFYTLYPCNNGEKMIKLDQLPAISEMKRKLELEFRK
ncbi:protein mono-ADP-ribosyltransferase PARP3 isoform X1 [Hyalella azteca]|uniref:NAD(+) ADP-ribosyltransferase n=1 Tax=Hyalella azteca TaxID=294128 RepID=A0A8B7N9K6_HYAAZ|nr:protein mono-ADP-ribosyltransferase PARP3 isoform X1 [Hyalella azteca]